MARHFYWAGLIALSLGIYACGSGADDIALNVSDGSAGAGAGTPPDAGPDGDVPDAPPDPDAGADTGPEPDPSEPFFSGDTIPAIYIKLPQPSIDTLNIDPKIYVLGDIEVHFKDDVISLPTSAVRLKGNYGSLRTLDQKAAFLINFDKFTAGQRLFGLEKLALNNMVQDPSMIHERLGYRLFREGGAPAPRSAYANVYVNGELYGLYATIEVVDNEEFLKNWFGGDSGNLYEGSYGSDFELGLLSSFDQDNGDDVNYADLQQLTLALDQMQTPETFVEDVSKVIDLDSYLTFAATEIFLGHWDGYAWTRNNFFVYNRPSDGRWVFVPWGIDQICAEYLQPFGGGGRIQQMCNASPPCRLKLAGAFDGVIKRAVDLDLIGEATALKDAIWDSAAADPRKEVDMGTVSWAIDATIEYLKNRPGDIEGQLACADPSTVDNDMDGFSGCGDDCDDMNPNVFPGAPEVCDFADSDCNGVWDDDPGCPQCIPFPAAGGGTNTFCFTPRSYTEAEADCVAQGGHLASIHSQAEQDEIASTALMIADDQWYMGLNDIKTEGKFTWTDGTPVDFTSWNGGEPNNAGNEDCGHLANWAGGNWNDIPCSEQLRYVCRLP